MSLIPRSFYLDDIFEDMPRMPKVHELHTMKCDVYEKDGNYNIEMDIPGYDKKDISIECEDGILNIVAEKSNEVNEEDSEKKYIRRERVYGKITRSFTFADIDEENITADFTNGILTVVIPKSQKQESKRIIEIN
ncbi:MAG: Hsp20/alpha crystallin family protein [Bacilli bacterium]|nr:Hsp20/alpha crystallin family protein [Bacillota bacterium]MBR6821506.1 Hsp20/alpha crystallin family protein [Bacilli bacterium]